MSIYTWTSEIKNIYVWTTPAKAVYVWTTKVRPTKMPWYQEVEYIQSSGTQYINTWVINQWTTLSVDMKFIITQTNPRGSEDWLFWAKGSSNQSPTIYIASSNKGELNSWCGSWTSSNITTSLSLNTLHTLTVNYSSSWRSWVYDGTSSSTSSWISNSANNTSWYMCFFSDGSTPVTKCYMKLYSAKITVNWTLTRDFVPCYRKSDSVIWLYDRVWKQFYTNAGSGTFTKWWDI